MKQRLDTYDRIPPAMADYLSQYGWHFSKKMLEGFAVFLYFLHDFLGT